MYITLKIKLNVGTKVFAVHKRYVDEKLSGGRVRICKVKTFIEKGGEIIPVLTEVGNAKMELDTTTHHLYYDMDLAIKAITRN